LAGIIGIDFDNTIVCYDEVFFEVAHERGLIPASIAKNKISVRDYLRSIGKEIEWTRLQGLVYGSLLTRANAFIGVKEFVRESIRKGIRVVIVSHKTVFPYDGEQINLHDCARAWLNFQGFFSREVGLNSNDVFFEVSKDLKVDRIRKLNCEWFVDDLPEIFAHPSFDPGVRKILFQTTPSATDSASITNLLSATSWLDVERLIFGDR